MDDVRAFVEGADSTLTADHPLHTVPVLSVGGRARKTPRGPGPAPVADLTMLHPRPWFGSTPVRGWPETRLARTSTPVAAP